MKGTFGHQIHELEDRFVEATKTLPGPELLNRVVEDCQRILQQHELSRHEKAVLYRLLGKTWLFQGTIGDFNDEPRFRACVALLTAQRYFLAEGEERSAAELDLLVAQVVAEAAIRNMPEWLPLGLKSATRRNTGRLLLDAERRARRAAKTLAQLGESAFSGQAVVLLRRIELCKKRWAEAWEEGRKGEARRRRPGQNGDVATAYKLDGFEVALHSGAGEETEIKSAVYRERSERLDALWLASKRFPVAPGDSVDCAVFAPPEASPGTSLLIQAFVYLPEHLEEASRRAALHDDTAVIRGTTELDLEVEHGDRLRFELNLPNATVAEPVQSLRWRGKTAYVTFAAEFSEDALGSQVGKLLISVQDIPVGVIRFLINVFQTAAKDLDKLQTNPTGRATRYHSAFISYASKDRPEVLRRVQILEALGIDFFQDLLSLDPGERWEKALFRAIDNTDLFLLFWSSAAQKSSFVRREIGYAVQLKRGQDEAPPEIIPIVIEGPPAPSPPEELAHLQFSDRILYFLPRPKVVVHDRWINCPACGKSFATYGGTWDGFQHTTCGTELEIIERE